MTSVYRDTRKPIFFNQSVPFFGYLPYKPGTPSQSEIKDGVESQRSLNVDVFRRITPLNLLHTVDDKKADKWIADIRWTVMVFDAIFVREDIL